MSDPLGKITAGEDLIGKIRNFLAGFVGYVKRENRREADKTLRSTVSNRWEEQWSRISQIQREMISAGQLEFVDDLEAAAIKIRTFIDRVKGASYGYAGFFDAVRINDSELSRLYEYDLALLESVDKLSAAVDNVEASLGTDGLPAAIRNLVTQSQEAIDTYNRRDEVILQSKASEA
jgi:translation elongation factor EF-4